MVENLGESSLKVILVLFAILNINKIMAFKGWSKDNLPFLCVGLSMFLSLLINWTTYSVNLSATINLLIAVFIIFMVLSQEERPMAYLWSFVFSAFFSSVLCLTTTKTITIYTFRKTGGTGDPNEFSITVLMPMFFLLGYILKCSKAAVKCAVILALFIFLVSLLYAGSKSAIITLALSAILYIGYLLLRRNPRTNKVAILFGIAIVSAFFVYLIDSYYSDTLHLMLDRFSNNRTAGERLKSWDVGLDLFFHNPFFGVGINNYSNMVGQASASLVMGSRAAHNMYIQSMTETGCIGFASFVWSLLAVLYRQFKNAPLPMELILAYIPLLIMGATLSLFLEKYVWIMIALLYNPYYFNSQAVDPIPDENYRDYTAAE